MWEIEAKPRFGLPPTIPTRILSAMVAVPLLSRLIWTHAVAVPPLWQGVVWPFRHPRIIVSRSPQQQEQEMAVKPNPSREAVRAVVPRMIELSESVINGDIWERPGLSKRD